MAGKQYCFFLIFSVIFLSIFVHSSEVRSKRKAIRPKSRKSYVPLFPTDCDSQFMMCNRTLNYPRKKMAKFIRQNKILRGSFTYRTSDNIASRQFDEEDGINMCDTSIAYSIPEAMVDEDGKMMFIVNNVENYTQKIEYDKCSERSGCMFSSHFPEDYTTACKQHKITIHLLSLKDNVIKMRPFRIPGGCACVYKLDRK